MAGADNFGSAGTGTLRYSHLSHRPRREMVAKPLHLFEIKCEMLVVEKVKQAIGLGSARVPRAVFGIPPKTSFLKLFSASRNNQLHEIRARRPNRHTGRVRSPFPNLTPPGNPRPWPAFPRIPPRDWNRPSPCPTANHPECLWSAAETLKINCPFLAAA